jgi:hypothetical protein
MGIVGAPPACRSAGRPPHGAPLPINDDEVSRIFHQNFGSPVRKTHTATPRRSIAIGHHGTKRVHGADIYNRRGPLEGNY